MIDNYAQVQELMRKMEAQLPIPARPTSTLIRAMRQHGVKLARDQELPVKRLFYMGDEGGISCDVTPPGLEKTPIICSITQIEIDAKHPLAQEIAAYQQERAKKLSRAGREPTILTVTSRGKKRKRRSR
jgi:hypothetical protein